MEDEQVPQWMRDLEAAGRVGDFKIGDEVVVTLNGECKRGVLHGEQEIGVRGTVIGLDGTRNGPLHPIWVIFRRPLPVVGASSYYAAGELQHFDLEAASAAIVDGQRR